MSIRYSCLAATLAFLGNHLAFASNCVPRALSTFTVAVATSGTEHLYWIDLDSLHLCTWNRNQGGAVDLTTARGLPIAASPVATAVSIPTASDQINVFYVDQNAYMVYLNNDGSGTELTGLGKISAWPSISAVYNPSNDTRSITYAVDADTSADKYGVRHFVARYDYTFKTSTSAAYNLYQGYGRSIEHHETQVNTLFDGNGRTYSVFDPEGQGHIHYISGVVGPNPQYQSQDLMDDVSVGGMNVTSGGGIVSPNNPTCQASGVATMELGGVAQPRMLFIGTDNHLHLLTGQGTAWYKNDITNDAGGSPLPSSCGRTAVANSTSEFYYYVGPVAPINGGNGYGIIQITRNQQGASSWTAMTANQRTGGCTVSPVLNTPLAATASNNAGSFFWVGQDGHTYRNCTELF